MTAKKEKMVPRVFKSDEGQRVRGVALTPEELKGSHGDEIRAWIKDHPDEDGHVLVQGRYYAILHTSAKEGE